MRYRTLIISSKNILRENIECQKNRMEFIYIYLHKKMSSY